VENIPEIWCDGWAKEDLPNERYKITVPITYIDMIISGQLLLKTGWAFESGDIIKVNDIEAMITNCETAWDFPNHTWILTIECDQTQQLKEMLTYSIEPGYAYGNENEE
jgi:hypothetical protein